MSPSKGESRGRNRPKEPKAAGRAREGTSAGARILAAIEEATELLRAEGLGSQRLTVRTYRIPSAPPVYHPGDVKRVRNLQWPAEAPLAAAGNHLHRLSIGRRGGDDLAQLLCVGRLEDAHRPPRHRIVGAGLAPARGRG